MVRQAGAGSASLSCEEARLDRRRFLTAVAGAPLALSGRAFAAPPVDGQAVRLSETSVRLQWSPPVERMSVFMSNDPGAPTGSLRPLEVSESGTSLDAPVTPRPYFLIQARDGRQARVAERLLPLKGGRNFRDLGGYRAGDGRQVRWGQIYRSGAMTGLTAGDLDYLARLGVAVVCDLRSPQERAAQPSPFLKAGGPEVLTHDYDLGSSLQALAGLKTRDQAVSAFAGSYLGFVDTLTPHYAEMFDRLLQAKGPLAMNCTAGKDRTGVGSALVLSVLGVPRETVIADYALTQVYTPPTQLAAGASSSALPPGQREALSRLPPEVLEVIAGSDPEVMRQALAGIDHRFGGPVALARARFGLTDAKIGRLRGLYLA
jgi:protein-tyrosine phosphatase